MSNLSYQVVLMNIYYLQFIMNGLSSHDSFYSACFTGDSQGDFELITFTQVSAFSWHPDDEAHSKDVVWLLHDAFYTAKQ